MWKSEIAESDYKLNKEEIRIFFTKLANYPDGCLGDYTHSKEILNEMNINQKDQDSFLEICRIYGGHCDCEIILNALDSIEGDFNTCFIDEDENYE